MRIGFSYLLIVLTLFLFARPAASSTNDAKSVQFGLGAMSCAQMTEFVRIQGDSMREIFRSYVDGYVSAINFSVVGQYDFFDGTDSLSRFKFVLAHCENNPTDTAGTALLRLLQKYHALPLVMERKRNPN